MQCFEFELLSFKKSSCLLMISGFTVTAAPIPILTSRTTKVKLAYSNKGWKNKEINYFEVLVVIIKYSKQNSQQSKQNLLRTNSKKQKLYHTVEQWYCKLYFLLLLYFQVLVINHISNITQQARSLKSQS